MVPKVLVLLGPTASGKTALGLLLAQALSAEIVSADSMLVYKGMDIGTAKPSPEERALVPHHLIDLLTPDQPYSAGAFQKDADKVIGELVQRGKVPLLLGGTHLYLKALVEGLVALPATDPALKAQLYERLAQTGVAPLYRELCALDPQGAAALHPQDSARVTRALEVRLSTGKSILSWQAEHGFGEQRYRPFYLAIHWEREELYQRIDRRTELMVQKGLVEETRGLLDQGYNPKLPSLQSIGYGQAVEYLAGRLSHSGMTRLIQQKSRRYAKKQLTWAKSIPSLHWTEPGLPAPSLLDSLNRFFDRP
ncbi:MAG: tRNA (adenosine(37)-N6)-dimethylallyltransferase MiaA [Candidatus Lambdaproteobacteria bacterium RIFOXYD1_FULL_56_27]|uniref:tRNA dimethylallyltransferase n=1 Tax=Candidatus Lambdaproteobacteria bacterium RIFOXYD2_FULL_56_26 TaxID=1817773 RepID=A0A1F6H2V8_9PROT|nr:MAG: tRNA (adenosine(37)-N6)-dimethylallyltransferase MiaA [Candidatus Lambdaproteobacteria bacterium RIFOXYD2_FULL_56_26]OGH05351.1 MAG: tRNA (adenosine(37)-N6)-dimethylallyltransferase MiaA [Candidatus Lambdaproteobacteria bacterium RIFOXYC1_FULL_56_13]OGH09193.1 MAG: tRNA (adenosine(37)-N6)-dimethylallyltransferase MiaA [Candidatus Lambdaproteobacteria bacterium RIFOXYD1_FULL_56_27]